MSSSAERPRLALTRRSLLWVVALPPLVLVLVLFVLPLGYLLFVSFMTPSQTQLFATQATLHNYASVLTDPFYRLIIRRTLFTSGLVLLACLLLGYPVAIVIAGMRPRGRLIMLLVMLFPLMVSNVVRAYGWIAVLGRQGIINGTLRQLGLVHFPLLMLYSLGAIVVGLLTILLPFMIISITNALVSIDRSYAEAAQSLGAGPVRTFLHVTWPLSSPGVASGTMLVFFLMLSAYVTISLLGGPRFKLLVSMVYDSVVSFQWPRAAALSFVLLAIALVFAALVLAWLRPHKVQGRGR